MERKSSHRGAGDFFLRNIIFKNFRLITTPLILIAFLSSCENDKKQIEIWTEKVVMKEEAVNVESLLSQQGKQKARLKAPLMVRMFGDTVYAEFPKSLHCDFYDDNMTIESWLDSKYGKYYENLGKVYLRDSVVLITAKGDTLRSPDLWWDQNKKIFYTDKYCVYTSPDHHVNGTIGLEATQDLKVVQFKYPTGTLKGSPNGLPESK